MPITVTQPQRQVRLDEVHYWTISIALLKLRSFMEPWLPRQVCARQVPAEGIWHSKTKDCHWYAI